MYQQLTLVGNLGGDPEMRYLENGTPVSNFSLAVNKTWTNSAGEKQDKITWFRVEAWNKRAEIVSQYLHKGSRVLIVGEVKEARAWTDRDGNARATIEVTASDIKFLGGSQEDGEGARQVAPSAQAPNDADIPF